MAELFATFVPMLGQALLHFVWQGALIGLLAALGLASLRNARPQARYAVACIALLACALSPVATLLLVSAPDWLTQDPVRAFDTFAGEQGAAALSNLSGYLPTASQLEANLPAIVAAWAAGTCLLCLRLALGLAWVQRLRNQPQGPSQRAWQQRLNAMATQFQLGRGVALRVVDGLASPVSAGWLRPMVLLPACLLTRMPADLVEALLAHELAHIRRHDYLVNLLQNVIEALLFYHPVVWWLSRRIRIEREQIADQLAAETACDPRRLALALAELSDFQRAAPMPALHLLQAAHGGHLMSRIRHLLRPARRPHAGARILFPLLGLAAAGIASFAWAQGGDSDDGVSITMHGTLRMDGKKHPDSFALVRGTGDEMHMWGAVDDIEEIQSARPGTAGEYLWFRRGDRTYIVTDPALLARAREATRETEEPDRKMAALDAQMEPHSRKVEMLSERLDALTDDMEPTPRAIAAERRLDALSQQQEELSSRQEELAQKQEDAEGNQALMTQLARQIDELGSQQDELGRQMDEQARIIDQEHVRFEERQAPIEALTREIEIASAPMEAISKLMDAQGREVEAASARVEQALRKLIDEALERKLATPLPRA